GGSRILGSCKTCLPAGRCLSQSSTVQGHLPVSAQFSVKFMQQETSVLSDPLYIQISPEDNVAIVVNEGGLPVGATFPTGLVLRSAVPQGHKVALKNIAQDEAVIRYGVVIGYALCDIEAGGWINESMLRMPVAPSLEAL